MEKVRIEIHALSNNYIIPHYASDEASGMDLYACIEEDVTILPMQWKLIPTGFAMSLNPGYEAQIRPRSGLALEHGITVLNSPGTIDSDYRGEVKILLINLGNNSFKIQPKMRIAQMIINKVFRGDIQIVDSLKESSRGSGGFGSTGKL